MFQLCEATPPPALTVDDLLTFDLPRTICSDTDQKPCAQNQHGFCSAAPPSDWMAEDDKQVYAEHALGRAGRFGHLSIEGRWLLPFEVSTTPRFDSDGITLVQVCGDKPRLSGVCNKGQVLS